MLSRAHVSGRATEPLAVPGCEYTVELNYKLAALRGVYLMPNVQYIRHPGGSAEHRNAAVPGLRVATDV